MYHRTNFERVNNQDYIQDDIAVFWGGLWVAIGAFGVVITSVLYAASPLRAVLPLANLLIPDTIRDAVAGQQWMLAAGTVGILSDIALATGAFVLMVYRKPSGYGIEASGWAWVAISSLIFIVVDSLVSHVLGPVAALGGPQAAFSGFKRLFDVLFALGTIAYGLGGISILWSEAQASSPVVSKAISYIGIIVGAAGIVGSLGYFLGVNLALLIGGAIGASAVVFTVVGIQIARAARRALRKDVQKSSSY